MMEISSVCISSMEANIRENQTLTTAYENIHNHRLFVGFIGTMFGVSVMIFLRLWLVLFGVYAMTTVPAVATVEFFLYAGHALEVGLVVKALIDSHVAITQVIRVPTFAGDAILLQVGLVYLILQFLTNLIGATFFVNFFWMGGLTARSSLYFHAAWRRATEIVPETPTNQVTPVLLVEGKAVGGSPGNRV